MGTTAEKLSYLKETKNQIKQALETPYNVFRDYPDLIKKYVDNQPTKTSLDGVCTDAYDVPLVSLNVDGNSEQETREGYNLLDFKETNTAITKNGLNYKKNSDGSIEVSGTPNRAWDYTMANKYTFKAGKTYTVMANVTAQNPPIFYFKFNSANGGVKNVPNGSKKTITIKEDEELNLMWSQGANSTVNFKAYILMYEGTDNKSYEPYTGGQPSPNPDYPQDIEVIDGVNLFDGKIEQGARQNGGTNDLIFSYKYVRTKNKIKVKPNTTYFISYNINKVIQGGDIQQYLEDGTYIGNISLGTVPKAFTTSEECFYINVQWYCATNIIPTDLTEIKLEKGTTQKPYLPYGHIGLKQSGKNVFKPTLETTTQNGVTCTKNNDGTYTLNGTSTADTYFTIGTDENLSPDITYKLVGCPNNGSKTTYRIGWNYHGYDNGGGLTNVKDTNIRKIQIYIFNGITVSNLVFKPMFTEDLTATYDDFEPYHEPVIHPINLNGNSIAKVGDVKDILKVNRNGEVEIKKNIGKVVLTGEEVLSDNSSTSIRKWWAIDFRDYGIYQYNDPTKVCDVLTTKFKSRPQQGEFLPGQIALTTSSKKIYFVFEPNTTEEQARAILKDMPVYFRLAEPQTIQLTSISPIELWQGTNIFSLVTNLDTTFEVEYVVNKDYIMNTLEKQNLLNIVEGENI